MTHCLRCKKRMARTRGVCRPCSSWMFKEVRLGRQTWEQLIAAGLVLPVVQGRAKAAMTRFLQSGEKK